MPLIWSKYAWAYSDDRDVTNIMDLISPNDYKIRESWFPTVSKPVIKLQVGNLLQLDTVVTEEENGDWKIC